MLVVPVCHLPPLKITHHQPKTKSVKKEVLFSGVEAEGSSVSEPAADPINDDDLDTTPALNQSLWSAPASVEDEPTHHELQSKSREKGWDLLRRKFLAHLLSVVLCQRKRNVCFAFSLLYFDARNVDRVYVTVYMKRDHFTRTICRTAVRIQKEYCFLPVLDLRPFN